MTTICVVVPCYNEAESLPYFLPAINETGAKMLADYNAQLQIIFVDDGSRDNTLGLLRDFAHKYKNIKYISFSRNFGKEAAIYAGLQNSDGDYAVLMDADLQHPPAMLEDMYLSLKNEEFDIVAARRISRKGEPILRSFFSKMFYHIINKISNAQFVDGASDFRMLSRKAVNAILQMGEYNRFSKGIFGWIGFKTKWLPYENVERVAGETKWSFWKLLVYSLEGIVGFSTAPLAIASVAGMILCFLSFLMIAYIIAKTLLFGDPVGGYPSLACMVIFMGGINLFCIGILGQYLAKTYLETKHRPVYIIAETNEAGHGE